MSELHVTDWDQFAQQTKTFKEMGGTGVSLDLFWGRIQPEPNRFDWSHDQRAFDEIVKAGLKVILIASTHACGGNVGDSCNIPLSSWLIKKHRNRMGYLSEAGNLNYEAPDVWSSKEVMDDIVSYWKAIKNHFGDSANNIAEIAISVGPSGEIQYPSRHMHDVVSGISEASYPERGVLQSFSERAEKSFQEWVLEKYGSNIEKIKNLWGFRNLSVEQISPFLIFSTQDAKGLFIPVTRHDINLKDLNQSVARINAFFAKHGEFSPFGQDYFEWNQASLLKYLKMTLSLAIETFHSDLRFKKIPISVKLPGIHWGAGSNRLPELTAGLISTAGKTPDRFSLPILPKNLPQSIETGYGPLLNAIAEVQSKYPESQVTLTYTALEMQDSEPGDSNASRGSSMARAILTEGRARGLTLSGENALSGSLSNREAAERISQFHLDESVSHLVLLRMSQVVSSPCAHLLLPKPRTEGAR